MPQGLQVFDASGAVVFDTNTRTTRVLGVISTTSVTSGSVSVPVGPGQTAYYLGYGTGGLYFSAAYSGNILNWSTSQPTGVAGEVNIFYGVY